MFCQHSHVPHIASQANLPPPLQDEEHIDEIQMRKIHDYIDHAKYLIKYLSLHFQIVLLSEFQNHL